MRFWLSWHQPSEDIRPLHFPPLEGILGWWRSGENATGEATLCALVRSTDEDGAKRAVLKDWPEAERWRFCNAVEDDYVPSERFPLSDWMKERTCPPSTPK